MQNDEAQKGHNRGEEGSSVPAKLGRKEGKFVMCLEMVILCEGVAGNGDEIVNPSNNLKGLDYHGN